MNPSVGFVAARRTPLVWLSSEARAAAFGLVATLAIEAVDHGHPAVGHQLGEMVGDVTDELELEERLAGRGRALTWNELLAFLAAAGGGAPAEPDRLSLPPMDAPLGARTLGFLFSAFAGIRAARRTAHRKEMLATFDERATIRTILETTPGPLAAAYRSASLDGLVYEVRRGVFDRLKRELPRRQRRRLTNAYRQDGMEGAAGWMIERVAGYPELFQLGAHAELDRGAGMVDSIVAEIQTLQDRPEERGRDRA
jgi:hypothetical protein